MADNYGLRKDIDKIARFIDSLEVNDISELLGRYYDQSEVDVATAKLNSDLTTLNTDLDNLLANLVEFNKGLIDFDDDNTNLEEDLSKLRDNLVSFVDSLGVLDYDLSALQQSLNDLDFQVNGDDTHDGLSDILQDLQEAIGTEDDSTSLKGMLHDFGIALQGVAQGDNALSLSLTTLSGYLTAFSGTLQEFKTQLSTDLGSSIYNGLDQQVINLVYAIASTQQDVSDHKNNLDDLSDVIGDSNDVLADGTLYGILNNTSSVASSASSTANTVSNTVTNTVSPTLNTVQNVTIPAIKTKIGYDDIGNTNLQAQITSTKGVIGNTSGFSGTIISNLSSQDGRITEATGNIASINSVIGNTNNLTSGTLISNINNALGDINEVQDDIGDMTTLTGDLVSNISSVQDGIGVVQDDIGILNTNLTSMLNPTTNLDFVYVTNDYPISMQDVLILEEDYGMPTLNWAYSFGNNQVYYRSGASWVAGSTPQNTSIGVGKLEEIPRIGSNCPFDYLYQVETKTYYERWIDPSKSGVLGYYGEWKLCETAPDFFEYTLLCEAIEDGFSKLGHTHSNYLTSQDISEKENTSNKTSSWNNTTNHTRYPTEKLVKDSLDGKQDNIPNFSLAFTAQTMYGLTVSTYTDGLNVYVTITGSLNGDSSLPTGGGNKSLGTLSDTSYAPLVDTYSPIRLDNNTSKIRIYSSGSVNLVNGGTSKTMAINCTFYYPLKSRFPSS